MREIKGTASIVNGKVAIEKLSECFIKWLHLLKHMQSHLLKYHCATVDATLSSQAG